MEVFKVTGGVMSSEQITHTQFERLKRLGIDGIDILWDRIQENKYYKSRRYQDRARNMQGSLDLARYLIKLRG